MVDPATDMFETILFTSSSDFVDEHFFYECVRHYIISLLAFICIYSISYLIIKRYRIKSLADSDYEDDLVFRVAVWLCCYTLAMSIGAVLLLPFSIVSNEILIRFPGSYYIRWLNESLIQSLWNHIFLGTYVAMFLAMPFAYFLTESEGLSGSRKGIKAKIYETFVVLSLLLVLVSTMVWVYFALASKQDFTWSAMLTESWGLPFPFLYSCISSLGALLLLISAPLGFTRLFTILGDFVVKPKFFVDLDDQIQALEYEEENLIMKIESLSVNGNNGIYLQKQEMSSEQIVTLGKIREHKAKLERERDASGFEKNLLYPLCLIGLLAVTAICLLMVAINVFKLVFGSESALPYIQAYPTLGKISISKVGLVGICLQIFLILYFMIASIVGLYSAPFFHYLTPVYNKTSMVKLIANCVILLVLSTALPVLSRTLGITNFNLRGEFSRLNWLANYQLILFYNVFFKILTSFCLFSKFTKSVRDALIAHFQQYSKFKSWKRWKKKD